jgi:2-polyprenyl-6-methoxyphenol hydroxylase-like FAD-dependent oxidoreductase
MSSSSMQSAPRIAIIGGGPGGLILARILQVNGFHASIYEREASPNERQQGGSLDLHPESGIIAMKAAGLFDQFKKFARYEGEQMKIIDKHGVVLFDEEAPLSPPSEGEDDGSNGRPEIDRYISFLLLFLL